MRLLVACLLLLALCGCGEATSDRPWQAYAWNSAVGHFIWLWVDNAATRDDCLFLAKRYVAATAGLERPSCAFQSNDEWLARLMGFVYGASDFQCLARSTSADAAKAGATYSYILGTQREGDNWYCI